MRLPGASAIGWYNGERTPLSEIGISVGDPAFHVGLGVFETIALRSSSLLELDSHLERLEEGARRLTIPLPPREELARVAGMAAEAEPADCGWLKILATRGGRWLIVTGAMDPADEERSLSAVLLPWRRNPCDPLAGVKTMSYAQNQLGLEEARRRGADEGFWLNTRGLLTEGCTSNLFLVRRRAVYTPGLGEGLLAGVVRGLAIDAVRALGLTLHEGRIRLKRLETADEAFVTSSLCGVRAVVRYSDRPVGEGTPGPLTVRIAEEVRRLRRPGRSGAKV